MDCTMSASLALDLSICSVGSFSFVVHTEESCVDAGLVQNTEVQLGCMKIRIGSLLAQCVGQVRVRADQGCGIFFTLKRKSCAVCNN